MIEFLLIVFVVIGLSSLRKITNRVKKLEEDFDKVNARLAQYEAGTVPPAATQVAADTFASKETTAELPDQTVATETAEGTGDTEVSGDTGVAETPVALETATLPRPAPRENLESNLGARWAVWVGGVALAFGGIFLIRYSIESGLLGPGARLALACLFGLILMGAGELVRRRAMPQIAERYNNAMIPGALTAAGAITLLGAVYAAHGYYGFIGPTTTFILLALVSFAVLGLSLLHGQALAGLGLLGSLVTPLLVATDAPNVTTLFGFLGITWVAANAASRVRQWTLVPMLANIGLALWAMLYTVSEEAFDPTAPTLALLVMIAGTVFLWPGAGYRRDEHLRGSGWKALLLRSPLAITLSVAFSTLVPALLMLAVYYPAGLEPLFAFACLMAALAALGGGRHYAVWPAIISAFGAILGVSLVALMMLDSVSPVVANGQTAPLATYTAEIAIILLLGAVFTLVGFTFIRRFRSQEPQFSALWSVLMSGMPVTLATISFLNFGLLGRDWTHGFYGLGIGLALLASAEWLFRRRQNDNKTGIDWPQGLLVVGSFAGFTLCLHALTNGAITTVLVSVLGFVYVMAGRLRPWPALGWVMAAALAIVFARIAWEPTLVGASRLGTTPFFNALLPGYGIPALLAVISAYEMRNATDFRIRNVLQALASLMVMATVAVLVRHAMNGGVLTDTVPTLGEQSIYTLLTIGFSGVLMTLDLKSPSPVFRYGSMIAGVIATLNVLSLHIFALNPFFSGEGTGPWPFVNLLLIGYLLPALAYAGVAWYARDRRPKPYVAMLAVAGGVLGFLWATLSVRRFWQGENIADWKGFLAGETYTYSVVWLAIGVALLAVGSKLDLRSIRLASAGLVLIAVVKVFLIDMSNLEGILRALSFIGLGAVLIGIGLFYQKILARKSSEVSP